MGSVRLEKSLTLGRWGAFERKLELDFYVTRDSVVTADGVLVALTRNHWLTICPSCRNCGAGRESLGGMCRER